MLYCGALYPIAGQSPTFMEKICVRVQSNSEIGRLESNSGSNGVRTFTPGVHVVRLAWGRMTYIGIYPDTVGLVTTLQRLSRAGVAEATAEKIEG